MKDRILVIDDEPRMCDFLKAVLSREGYEVATAGTAEEGALRLSECEYDVIITDMMLPGESGLSFLERVKKESPDTVVIMITGYSTVETAVEAMKLGAFDYLPKPFKINEIKVVIEKALGQRRVLRENRALKRELEEVRGRFDGIIGKSKAIEDVMKIVRKVAATDSTVLICGESGTGKELVARAIHHYSPRRDNPFVSINCAALPENLLESELFGHARGAFTGAVTEKRGLFEEADKGSIFLDEVGDISLALQGKLLRVLENYEFMRVGETKVRRVDVRVICATNRDLTKRIAEGYFREDLFFRLNVINIELPPLRERREDIPLLVTHFLDKLSKRLGKTVKGVSREAMELMIQYPWPGNVRELENAIERALILTDKEELTAEYLPDSVRGSSADTVGEEIHPLPSEVEPPATGVVKGEGRPFIATVLEEVAKDLRPHDGAEKLPFNECVDTFKRVLLLKALEKSGGVQARAAEFLDLKRTTLNEMLKRLDNAHKPLP